MERIMLWENDVPGYTEGGHIPYLTYHAPRIVRERYTAVVICPGGAYSHRSAHEGDGYAEFLSALGIAAFTLEYRVAPTRFPYPLLDARRAIRYVRANSERFKVDRVLIMGSSAGGHLAALTSTYTARIDGEGIDAIDGEEFMPDAQILCYPVTDIISHRGSYCNLLGESAEEICDGFDPIKLATANTPEAFIWHTVNDATVDVKSTYRFASRLAELGVPHELHVFPDGLHGIGLALEGYCKNPHVSSWAGMLENWLRYRNFI